MKTSSKDIAMSRDDFILGEKAGAAIAALEGLVLSPESRKRLADMEKRGLSPDEQRAEIIRFYKEAQSRA